MLGTGRGAGSIFGEADSRIVHVERKDRQAEVSALGSLCAAMESASGKLGQRFFSSRVPLSLSSLFQLESAVRVH